MVLKSDSRASDELRCQRAAQPWRYKFASKLLKIALNLGGINASELLKIALNLGELLKIALNLGELLKIALNLGSIKASELPWRSSRASEDSRNSELHHDDQASRVVVQ